MVLVLLVLLETAPWKVKVQLIRLRRPWGRAAVCVQRVIVMRLGVSFSQQCADRRGAGASQKSRRIEECTDRGDVVPGCHGAEGEWHSHEDHEDFPGLEGRCER